MKAVPLRARALRTDQVIDAFGARPTVEVSSHGVSKPCVTDGRHTGEHEFELVAVRVDVGTVSG
ncbi:hypothetical protein GCM10011594_32560 [Nakamurella endophytica]|uniref:Uncharacterized protein n=1 Tax=Nakamurella endophytica TaxID=1748367 RepID=A0A917WK89_9ACTN|nr:hypothetical protein GCM10011594_32560 [Nakamurella endophytica]